MGKNSKTVHVLPGFEGGWVAKDTGSSRASRRFGTKEEALAWAVKQARKRRGELVVHQRDGTVRDVDSYGRDPQPSRDRARSIHVVPSHSAPGKFVNKVEGNPRPISRPATQQKSIEKAIPLAKRYQGEVVIHRRDGTIRDSDSYSKNSPTGRDRKH